MMDDFDTVDNLEIGPLSWSGNLLIELSKELDGEAYAHLSLEQVRELIASLHRWEAMMRINRSKS